MAVRDERKLGGFAALAFLSLLLCGAAAGLLVAAATYPGGAWQAIDGRMVSVVSFTLKQATLSTLISVGLALPLAVGINRHPAFPGRALLLRLFALPMALPAIVAALAILALFGRNGWLAQLADFAGIDATPNIYGLTGILIAHVFFNLPLGARLLLAALEAAPANRYRLAAQLGMNERALFRFVEWPLLLAALPGVAMLVAMLCLTSFTIVLLLGGGPAATTLEVEIYQALRYDFDPARAAMLVAVQLALAAIVALVAGAGEPAGEGSIMTRRPRRRLPPPLRIADFALICAAALFIVSPLAAIASAGSRAELMRLADEGATQRALATSLIVATVSAVIAATLALALAAARKTAARRKSRLAILFDRGAYMILAVPATALGAGWFLLANRYVDPAQAAIPLVIAINAAMALPFAYRTLRPAHDAARDRNDRLCASLGIRRFNRWRLVDWPTQRAAILSALAFAAALSLGDLGVIALFGSEHVQTLPWLLLARMGSYRTADAEGLALLLALLCLALMMTADRLATDRNR